MKAIIQQLVETAAPSGYENAMRELVRSLATPHADSIEVDSLGNLVVRKGSRRNNGLRIMVAAHMDEIGILASHIDEKGFIRFTRNGGVRAANCLGGRVDFLNGVQGVIGSEKLDNPDKTPTFEQLFIDVGATSRDDCPVNTGDVAVFERPFLDLGKRLVAKALDDRVGVAVMLDVLSKLKDTPHEVLFTFTVQEEVGTRGALAPPNNHLPEIWLGVVVSRTGDTPRSRKMQV
jgi:endoglucanase